MATLGQKNRTTHSRRPIRRPLRNSTVVPSTKQPSTGQIQPCSHNTTTRVKNGQAVVIDLTEYNCSLDERRDDGNSDERHSPSQRCSIRQRPGRMTTRERNLLPAKQQQQQQKRYISSYATTRMARRKTVSIKKPSSPPRLFLDTRHMQQQQSSNQQQQTNKESDWMSAFSYEFHRPTTTGTTRGDGGEEPSIIGLDDILVADDSAQPQPVGGEPPSQPDPTDSNNKPKTPSIESIRRAAKLLQLKQSIAAISPPVGAAKPSNDSPAAAAGSRKNNDNNNRAKATTPSVASSSQSSIVTVEAIRRAARIIRESTRRRTATTEPSATTTVQAEAVSKHSVATKESFKKSGGKNHPPSEKEKQKDTTPMDVGRMLLRQNAALVARQQQQQLLQKQQQQQQQKGARDMVAPQDTSGTIARLSQFNIRGNGPAQNGCDSSKPSVVLHSALNVAGETSESTKRYLVEAVWRTLLATAGSSESGANNGTIPMTEHESRSTLVATTRNSGHLPLPPALDATVPTTSRGCDSTNTKQAREWIQSVIETQGAEAILQQLVDYKIIDWTEMNRRSQRPGKGQRGEALQESLQVPPSNTIQTAVASHTSAHLYEKEENELFAVIDPKSTPSIAFSPSTAHELQNQVDDAFEFDFISHRSSMRISPPLQTLAETNPSREKKGDSPPAEREETTVGVAKSTRKPTVVEQSIDIAPRPREAKYGDFIDDSADLDQDAESVVIEGNYNQTFALSDDSSSVSENSDLNIETLGEGNRSYIVTSPRGHRATSQASDLPFNESSQDESSMASALYDSESLYSDMDGGHPAMCAGLPFATNVYDVTCTWLEAREGTALCNGRTWLRKQARRKDTSGKVQHAKVRKSHKRIPRAVTTFSKYLASSQCKAIKKVRSRLERRERQPQCGDNALQKGQLRRRKGHGNKKKKTIAKSRKNENNFQEKIREIKDSIVEVKTAITTATVTGPPETRPPLPSGSTPATGERATLGTDKPKVTDPATLVAPKTTEERLFARVKHENPASAKAHETMKHSRTQTVASRRKIHKSFRGTHIGEAHRPMETLAQDPAAGPDEAIKQKEQTKKNQSPESPWASSLERLRKKGVPNRKYIRAINPPATAPIRTSQGANKEPKSEPTPTGVVPDAPITSKLPTLDHSQTAGKESRCRNWRRRKDQLPKRTFRSS